MLGKLLKPLLLIIAVLLFLSVWKSLGTFALLISTLIALLAIKILAWLGIHIEINLWSILILLIGGVPGLFILVLLNVTGIAFRAKR